MSDTREWSRREFVRVATVAASAFGSAPALLLSACGEPPPLEMDSGPPEVDAAPPPIFDLPSLGGAPDTEEGRTIAALVDTLIPGAHRDPTGAPGGIDVGAAALFFDPLLPAAQFVPILSLVLDQTSRRLFAPRRFVHLVPTEREDVVARALIDVEVFEFAVLLAKLAYFSSDGAAAHLGYPGANPGWVHDPDFTFGTPMATEITTDGNLP